MATGQRWQEPIELGQCWVRAGQLAKAVEQPQNLSLSFAELHIERVDLNLFDAQGRLIGRAQRMGSNSNALGSGQRAIFLPPDPLQLPLYAQFTLADGARPLPGLARILLIEALDPSSSMHSAQRADRLNLAIAVLLVATAITWPGDSRWPYAIVATACMRCMPARRRSSRWQKRPAICARQSDPLAAGSMLVAMPERHAGGVAESALWRL
jgi:hypothetical protein